MSGRLSEFTRAEVAFASLKTDPAVGVERTFFKLSKLLAQTDRHIQNISRDKGKWRDLRLRLLTYRAHLYESSGKGDLALRDVLKAITGLSNDVPNSTKQSLSIVHGRCMMLLGMHNDALDIFMKVWNTCSESADTDVTGVISGNIATVIFNLKHYTTSLEWFRKTADIYQQIDNKEKQAQAVRGVGMCLSKLGKYNEALQQYSNALKLLDDCTHNSVEIRIQIVESIGVDYLNLADTTHKQSYYKNAHQRFSLCLQLAKQHRLTVQMTIALRNLGLVLCETTYKQHDVTQAMKHLKRSLTGARKAGLKLLEAQVHRDLSIIQELTGDLKGALQSLRRWHELDRELFNARADQQVVNLQIQLAVEQSEARRQQAETQIAELQLALKEEHKKAVAMSMAVAQQTAVIQSARFELQSLAGRSTEREVSEKLRQVSARLKRVTETEDHWLELEAKLAHVQGNQLPSLISKHPGLTPTERRVCVLIHHEMSTKDMASLLGVEPRSIEKYRQRIRKKLQLTNEVSLSVYLASL